MATGNFSDSHPVETTHSFLPKVGPLMMFRIGIFQMGLGILTVLTLAVLNRVMITELQIPAPIVSSALAMSLLIAPARVWLGQISDARPLFQLHRSVYVWLGSALFMPALFAVLQVVWQLGALAQTNRPWIWSTPAIGWTALLLLFMVFYGLTISLSSTTFFALLVDVSDDDNRGQLVGVVWTMMTVGLAIGGISSKILLRPLDDINVSMAQVHASINSLFLVVPLLVFGLALLATWGVEQKYSRYRSRSMVANREDKITLGTALKILTASRQTGLFFTFLLVMTIGLFMQETVLEPYGGEIFRMSIPETSLLNTYWAMGMLFSLMPAGFFLIPRLGKRGTTKLGCWAVAFCFLLIVLAGFTADGKVLKLALVLFGLSTGVLTTGALSLTLDLTAAETAGTFSGAWGLGQAMARGIAIAAGGYVLSIGKNLLGVTGAPEAASAASEVVAEPSLNLFLAFSLVFVLQAIVMVFATGLLDRVNVQEFRETAKGAIAAVMESELD